MTVDRAALVSECEKVLSRIPNQPNAEALPVYIYGAGLVGTWAADYLISERFPISGFLDRNADLTGQSIKGIKVYHPDQFDFSQPCFVFVAARHVMLSVCTMLDQLGVLNVGFDSWYLAAHFDDFMQVHDRLLDDAKSRETYRSVMMALMTADARYCEEVMEKDQYYCLPQFSGVAREIFVDAGAFVGDSVERFIWAHAGSFREIHAFEPGKAQFDALTFRMARLTKEWALTDGMVKLNNFGLGAATSERPSASSSGELQSQAFGAASTGETSHFVTLDAYLNGRPASFIKMDVEGMERDLIAGAKDTIVKHHPRLAVSIYHNPHDMWGIAQHLKTIVPDYKFAVRHHHPKMMETILYAWTD